MTLQELLDKIYEYPRDIDVLMDTADEKSVDFSVEVVIEEGKVIGLILVEDKQLDLPFGEEK